MTEREHSGETPWKGLIQRVIEKHSSSPFITLEVGGDWSEEVPYYIYDAIRDVLLEYFLIDENTGLDQIKQALKLAGTLGKEIAEMHPEVFDLDKDRENEFQKRIAERGLPAFNEAFEEQIRRIRSEAGSWDPGIDVDVQDFD